MAKSRAKSKDAPTIAVTVEKGRLVPVSAYDLELIGQWREGAILNIEPVLAQTRPLERRYFAMLTKLLKTADTPWSNVLTAHEALKLATGFVEPYQKKSGKWDAHPRHISTFTDAELEEFVALFYGIVRKRFDLDPDVLEKESADTGNPESSVDHRAQAADPDDGPDVDPIPADVGEPSSSATNPAEDGPETGGGSGVLTLHAPSSVDGVPAELSGEDLAWLKQAARMLVAATEPGGDVLDAATIDRQLLAIKQNLTPATISYRAKTLCRQIYDYCVAACVDHGPFDKKWIATVAGCTVADLRPEAR